VLAGLGYLIDRSSGGVLSYLRVLAWPAVAVLGIFLLRRPIIALLRGLYLKEIGLPGGPKLRFDTRQQEASDPEQLLEVAPGEAGAVADRGQELRVAHTVGRHLALLTQSFQIQLDFLRALGAAPQGLTRDAAHAWFADELERRHFVANQWDIPTLLSWLENNGLVELNQDGALVRSSLGNGFAGFIERFWYAPKAF